MAPTIQNGSNAADKRAVARPQEKRSELITRVKYCNTLPDIPFDLKFITYPFENDRFIQYKPTSLERNYRYEVLTEHDLGVTIDLINRDLYQIDQLAVLDPADEKLLEEDIHTPQDSMRSSRHAKSVSWLRKSEYISTEQTRFQPQTMEKVEAKVGFNVKASLREETLYMDREAQIKAIEKTFEDNKKEITAHYSKPGVVPVEVLPVFPDFANWKYPCAQVIFDFDPAPAGKNVPAQMEEMSQAMIRGVMDESGEQFVAYFLPTEETLEKRRRDLVNETLYEDDEEYEYKMAREYNWNVKSKASKGYEENYFLVLRQDGMYYNELETRVRLSKRRQKVGQQPNNTKLVVKHRPLNAPEHRMQRYRERQLEPPGEEDEEDIEDEEPEESEEEEEEEEQQQGQTQENAEEDGDGEGKRNEEDGRGRSRSRSGSRSSRSRSRSGSGSRSRSGSRASSRRSGSGSRAGSRATSRSRSRSGSRSGSGSPAGSRKSRSRSRSGGSGSERSRSGSGGGGGRSSRSRSGSARSRSGSPGSGGGGSRRSSRSRSGSRGSGSGSGGERSGKSGSESE